MKTIVLLFALIIVASAVVFIFPKNPQSLSPLFTSPSVTPSPVSQPDEAAEIKKDVIDTSSSCGPAKDKCTIDKVFGNYAKGTMPMGYWFASRKDNKWQVIMTGNGIPACAKVDEFSIPRELYDNCLDAANKLRY